MVPFKMTLTLATPVIMPFHTTLDGLLSYAGEAMTGLRDASLVDVLPLARDEASGIFRASSIFLSRNASYEKLVKVRSLKHWDLDAMLIAPKRSKAGKLAATPYSLIDKTRGAYANKLSVMSTLRTPKAVCYGVGDIEQVKLLMECVQGLGRHAHQGQGEILQVDIEPVESDGSWVDDAGRPRRPIPVAVWQAKVGRVDSTDVAIMPTRFPYWLHPPEPCVAPAHTVVSL